TEPAGAGAGAERPADVRLILASLALVLRPSSLASFVSCVLRPSSLASFVSCVLRLSSSVLVPHLQPLSGGRVRAHVERPAAPSAPSLPAALSSAGDQPRLLYLDPRRLEPNADNVRRDSGDLETLA